MPEYNLDFSDVNPDSSTVVSQGEHKGVVTEVKIRLGKESEMPYLNFKLTIEEGGDYDGRVLYGVASMGSKRTKEADAFVMGRLLTLLRSFGINQSSVKFVADEDGDDEEGRILIEPDLTGLPVIFWVKNAKFDGVMRSQIKWFHGSEPIAESGEAESAVAPQRRRFTG